MPRYRFSWDNLPPRLLEALRADLGLGRPAARSLRRAYGARPKADFVHRAWPTLLGSWLARNPNLRRAVVKDLRARRLGDQDAPARSAADQMAYLRSCRNSKTLREIVLAHFLVAGETVAGAPPPPPVTPVPASAPAPLTAAPPVAPATGARDLDAFVADAVRDMFGPQAVARDGDGDLFIRSGSAVFFIRATEDADGARIQAFSYLVGGLERSPQLLETLNEINLRWPQAQVVHTREGSVLLRAQVPARRLAAADLQNLIQFMYWAADFYDSALAETYGGETWFDDDGDAVAV